MEILTYSEFANMPASAPPTTTPTEEVDHASLILGELPQAPPTVGESVAAYVEECKRADLVEEIAGDEDTFYDTERYFENTINEIADNMGMTTNGVLSVISRVKDKITRRLFIINHLDGLREEEMIDVLNSGIANIKKILCNDFL